MSSQSYPGERVAIAWLPAAHVAWVVRLFVFPFSSKHNSVAITPRREPYFNNVHGEEHVTVCYSMLHKCPSCQMHSPCKEQVNKLLPFMLLSSLPFHLFLC